MESPGGTDTLAPHFVSKARATDGPVACVRRPHGPGMYAFAGRGGGEGRRYGGVLRSLPPEAVVGWFHGRWTAEMSSSYDAVQRSRRAERKREQELSITGAVYGTVIVLSRSCAPSRRGVGVGEVGEFVSSL